MSPRSGGGSLEAARGAHLYLCNSRQSTQITDELGLSLHMHEGGQLEHMLAWCLFAQFVENTAPTSEFVMKGAIGFSGLSALSR